MKYRKIILFSVILFIALGLIGIWFINKNIYPFWNANVFNISAEQPLTTNKIKVYFGISVNTINRENDSDLFNNMNKYTVIYDRVRKDEMINEYGENDFLVIYDDKFYFSFRQFKTYWRAQHTYDINIVEQEGKPVLQIDIKGHDPMKFSRTMIPIKDAEQYRCNVLKENAGVLYNMIELVDK